MKRLKLAWCSPMPPQRSGVADYSEELLPHLREFADVDVVVGRGVGASCTRGGRDERLIEIADLTANAASYDAVVYQVANNVHHHGYMFPCLMRVPGLVVLHDYCLQYLMLGLTLGRGDLAGLERILAPTHGETAKALARQLLFGSIDPETMSFGGPVVEASRLVIVHSEYARGCVLRDFPAKPVRVVPMGVAPAAAPASSDSARLRFGLQPTDFVVASVTGLVFTKRLSLVLAALRAVREQTPHVKLIVVGGGSPGRHAAAAMAQLEDTGAVVRTGWVPPQDYRDLIATADAVVDMRYPSGAETSASLARALAAGKPLIVSAHGASAEIPDDCCTKIAVGAGEDRRLTDAILDIVRNPVRRSEMSCAARRFAVGRLRLEDAALAYLDCIREAIRCQAPAAASARPEDTPPRAQRMLVSLAYRAFRLRYLRRNYGAGYTFKRICHELGTAARLRTV
jgi:glycosyltransferase involved in cell wall biosynthesis